MSWFILFKIIILQLVLAGGLNVVQGYVKNDKHLLIIGAIAAIIIIILIISIPMNRRPRSSSGSHPMMPNSNMWPVSTTTNRIQAPSAMRLPETPAGCSARSMILEAALITTVMWKPTAGRYS